MLSCGVWGVCGAASPWHHPHQVWWALEVTQTFPACGKDGKTPLVWALSTSAKCDQGQTRPHSRALVAVPLLLSQEGTGGALGCPHSPGRRPTSLTHICECSCALELSLARLFLPVETPEEAGEVGWAEMEGDTSSASLLGAGRG